MGGTLPDDEFEVRHRFLLRTLWIAVVAMPLLGLALGGFGVLHDLVHGAGLVAFAVIASHPGLSRRVRSVACALGLLTVAALGVHITGGSTEAHFTFFVVIIGLTVYEDWTPFLVSVLYVLLHHGILGMVAPDEVFSTPAQLAHPWAWASIHAAFIAAAGAASIAAWRLNESVRDRMLDVQHELERAAATDELTGMGNRRRLVEELEQLAAVATPDAPVALAIFDLDGFKLYNDTFGHQAGDVLLRRLGTALSAAAAAVGTAYRLGGDEFCVLARTDRDGLDRLLADATAALTDRGEGFSVTASCGSALLPIEAEDVSAALRIADERMYQQKAGSKPSAGSQSKDVLLRALAERHPDLGHHLDWLADVAAETASIMGCPPDEIEQIRHAAELHDIGKVAIPRAILSKPEPLDPSDWEFIKRHPAIGERIIAAAPALARAAKMVRSSHERWDGCGYPDGLTGEEIPLGARIISVCDALDAMLTNRPYQQACSLDEAINELLRCAGTQFDVRIVAVVERLVHSCSARTAAELTSAA